MSNANIILERVAAIQATIGVPGEDIPIVLATEPYQPSNAESVNCPFFINMVNTKPNKSDIPIASGLQYITTNVAMALSLARWEANNDLKYGVKKTLAWRDAVYAMFAQHVKLSSPTVLIQASTNANPIVVSCNTPHCLANPTDQVTVSGVAVNTNANGVWNSTYIDPVTFSIPVAGNGIGGATGTAVKTQNGDLNSIITDAVISEWSLNKFEYGDLEFLALIFILQIEEMYVQTIM